MSSNREINLVNARNGCKTIIINNLSLHSRYNPINEAKAFIDANKHIYEHKNTIVVYGMGLGYHIKELLNRTASHCKIYVFDIDAEINKVVESTGLLNKILIDTRLHFYSKENNYFYINLLDVLEKVQDIIIYKPSLQVLPEKYNHIKNILNGYELGKIGINKFSDVMKISYQRNQITNYRTIEDFFDSYKFNSKPIIIVSAGPSLNDCIDELKQVKDKVRIFSVGSALKQLMLNGIKPYMAAIIDAQDVVYEQIKGFEDLDIPLCFLSTASNLAVSKYNGPKYMFYNEDIGGNRIISTGKSVATALLSIAIEGGANPVIFVGQDLAFVNNLDHCALYPHGVNRIDDSLNYKKVEGVDGSLLNTTDGLLYFKHWIEKRISENINTKFYNCSRGAIINGAISKKLSELTFMGEIL